MPVFALFVDLPLANGIAHSQHSLVLYRASFPLSTTLLLLILTFSGKSHKQFCGVLIFLPLLIFI